MAICDNAKSYTAGLPLMPVYKSHKTVQACQIQRIERTFDGEAIIQPVDQNLPCFGVSAEYVNRHQPKAGGYFVLYADGYQSWSPAEAFEDGYSLLTADDFQPVTEESLGIKQ